MPTIGLLSGNAPAEPWKVASPYVKMPPSLATSQYPPPSFVVAMPTMGLFSGRPPSDPQNGRFPKSKTPPSVATMSYPTGEAGALQGTSPLTLGSEIGATKSRRAAPQLQP